MAGIFHIFHRAESGQDALQVKLEALVSSQGTSLAPHLCLRDVASRDLVAVAKTAQLVGHSRSRNGFGSNSQDVEEC